MAFWGVEVRPGKPYSHVFDRSRGRLRVSQATLDFGKGTTRSLVQCNVGNKRPILLCSLIPNVSESFHLELEFEEHDEVVFSVLGQISVHLSGYYLGSGVSGGGDDSEESYGEDIADTESDRSGGDEDDKYESDFIDDDEIELPPCPKSTVIEEIKVDEKPANGKSGRRRLRKKYEISDSDEDGVGSEHQPVVQTKTSKALDSKEEDGFPISFFGTKKNVGKKAEENGKSDDKSNLDKKRKIDTVIDDLGSERKLNEIVGTPATFDFDLEKNKMLKKKKNVKSKNPNETERGGHDEGRPAEMKIENKENDLIRMGEGKSVNGGKSKKNKKEILELKASGAVSSVSTERTERGNKDEAESKTKVDDHMDEDLPKVEQEKLPTKKIIDGSATLLPVTGPESTVKQKKKKKMTRDEKSQAQDGVSPGVNRQTEDKQNQNETADKNSDVLGPAAAEPRENKRKRKKGKDHDKSKKPFEQGSD